MYVSARHPAERPGFLALVPHSAGARAAAEPDGPVLAVEQLVVWRHGHLDTAIGGVGRACVRQLLAGPVERYSAEFLTDLSIWAFEGDLRKNCKQLRLERWVVTTHGHVCPPSVGGRVLCVLVK